MTNLFITGTDTGVGKTHVTALLLAELRRRGLRAAAFKPIACGAGGRDDARRYRRLMQNEVPLDRLNPIYLRHPLAPSVAARLEHRRINLASIHRAYSLLTTHYSPLLVEGAGGLLVPICRDYFVADLVRDLRLPLLIVARLGLGTINHTLLTIRQAQAAGLTVCGVIVNDTNGPPHGLAERTNVRELQRLLDVPVWGPVPFQPQGSSKRFASPPEGEAGPPPTTRSIAYVPTAGRVRGRSEPRCSPLISRLCSALFPPSP